MRIALVADTFSVEKGTGIARYSQEILKGLLNKGLTVEPIAPRVPNLPLGLAINHALKMPYVIRSRSGRFDVIHATSPITALAFPAIGGPKVVTYHDLLSLLCKSNSTAFYTRLLAPIFLRIGRYADRIIANSTQTKEELGSHLGMPRERITVTPWGVSEIFEPRRRGEQSGCVIGYVGAFNRRKGLPYLIRALHILRQRRPELPFELMICGPKDQGYSTLVRLVSELSLSSYVNFVGALTDTELVEAYNSFDVFVLPSEWEGFGLPILEAQRCGVPAIIRQDAHIPPEVAECCLRAACEEDMADKIYELLANEELRQATIEQGLEYSRAFTWDRTVRETLRVYEQAISLSVAA